MEGERRIVLELLFTIICGFHYFSLYCLILGVAHYLFCQIIVTIYVSGLDFLLFLSMFSEEQVFVDR